MRCLGAKKSLECWRYDQKRQARPERESLKGRGIAMNKARKTTRKLSKAERSEAIKKGIRRNRLVRKRRAEAEAKRT